MLWLPTAPQCWVKCREQLSLCCTDNDCMWQVKILLLRMLCIQIWPVEDTYAIHLWIHKLLYHDIRYLQPRSTVCFGAFARYCGCLSVLSMFLLLAWLSAVDSNASITSWLSLLTNQKLCYSSDLKLYVNVSNTLHSAKNKSGLTKNLMTSMVKTVGSYDCIWGYCVPSTNTIDVVFQ